MTQAAATPYPVTIRGDLTEPVNRWIFLIKWLLLIPHLVVLLFLYIGFVVMWIVSLFAILSTGRFPRGPFDYMVGVLRWSWRVGFYGYQALGTDQYPPFTLQKRDDYPADLDVVYPAKLSKGLVLVKWWLLAIPQYIIVGVLQGSGSSSSCGLATVLVLFAAIANLFTGKYPRDIWDLAMAANHWSYRVVGYAALTTDEYPPFRLGQ